MYSKDNQYPVHLTNIDRIRLKDGSTRTGGNYADNELEDAGYKYVGDMPESNDGQIVEWNSEAGSWNVREKTQQEIDQELASHWQIVIDRKENELRESDWTQLADAFDGAVDAEYQKEAWGLYREKLRGINVSTNRDPLAVVWPQKPTDRDSTIISQLADGNQE